ncbi:hypothetical protein SAMN06269250_2461 [Spirosoma fluviale]|uniref:Uncharacterized protein n=1 Tax=Spirosoma fluviale TaxID=1597977 RepID=A0A286FYD3_9BACT|nr:hypothetical protein SAMN06269250_2461 [Spirosoma fluviale]
MKKAKEIELNDYHKARNERLIRIVSGQPLMSQEEFIEQTRRLARQSNKVILIRSSTSQNRVPLISPFPGSTYWR